MMGFSNLATGTSSLFFLSLLIFGQIVVPSQAFVATPSFSQRYTSSTTSIKFTPAVQLFSTRGDANGEEPHIVVQILQQFSPAEIVFMLGILLLLATTTPLTSSATNGQANLEHGQSLFLDNCAVCHRGGQNIMKPSKTLQESDLLRYLGDSDFQTIAKFFQGSFQHKMLSFPKVPGGKLTDADVEDVALYVSSQAVQDKW
jgi:cytochrome c6